MTPLTRLTVGVGAGTAGSSTHDLVLDIAPHHPSTHGMLRLRLTLDGERIVACEPVVGYLHRGVEKLFEVRDYRQIVVLANRHDWLSAFSSELGVVLAVERMLGLEVPRRATWARTLLAELNRVLSHLMFLGAFPVQPAAGRPAVRTSPEREQVQAVMEELTGGRMHYMFNRVGGLKEDLPAGWLLRVADTLTSVRQALPRIEDGLLGSPSFEDRTRGIGVLRTTLVDAYGVSGPVARASGADLDLRRDEPYLAYGDLLRDGVLEVPVRHEGDCYARVRMLLDQVAVSLALSEACVERLARLDRGPVNVRLPKVLRPPEGATYAWTENPLGINGYYLVSRGAGTPWRMKLRTASFNNVAVLPELLEGCRLADLVTILGSLFFVVGDIDK
ncbi:MAG TPA: NADH-quinone oxidoreductase subunit D [Nocardioidaceae bacterium]|jgi:NADH-quinone oxidoreductase subunit D|nr:NADH-quinone oxidoreductase subunit D [Nocardioidaceae bacterium]